MRIIRIFMLGAVAALVTPNAFAQQPAGKTKDSHWYAVEVIVFRPTAATAGSRERWPADPRLPETSDAVVPGSKKSTASLPTSATTAPAADVVLPLSHGQYQLGGVRQRLKQSGRYRVLLHTGWIEPGLPRGKAPKVSITPLVTSPVPRLAIESGNPGPGESPWPPSKRATSAPANPAALNLKERVAPPDTSTFGTIKLVYSRFPSVALDVAYRPADADELRTWQKNKPFATPATTLTPAESGFSDSDFAPEPHGPRAIVLNQSRRIKTKTINYFDNPVFGVILQVRPVKPPADMPPDTGE